MHTRTHVCMETVLRGLAGLHDSIVNLGPTHYRSLLMILLFSHSDDPGGGTPATLPTTHEHHKNHIKSRLQSLTETYPKKEKGSKNLGLRVTVSKLLGPQTFSAVLCPKSLIPLLPGFVQYREPSHFRPKPEAPTSSNILDGCSFDQASKKARRVYAGLL